MTAVEDLDQWQRKTVGLTTSIDLVNLERHAQVSQDLLRVGWALDIDRDAFQWEYILLLCTWRKIIDIPGCCTK